MGEVLPQTWRGGSLPAGIEGGRREGGKLGCDGEDAVEFAVGAGSCYGGGNACEDSVAGSMNECGMSIDSMSGDGYLVLPKRTSATPQSSPKEMSRLR